MLMETANLKDDSILECYVLLQHKPLQQQISKYYHFSIINTRNVCIAVTRQLASSCSRRGMVAARFTSERPGCGTRLSETFALSVAHLWFQSLRTFSATDRQRWVARTQCFPAYQFVTRSRLHSVVNVHISAIRQYYLQFIILAAQCQGLPQRPLAPLPTNHSQQKCDGRLSHPRDCRGLHTMTQNLYTRSLPTSGFIASFRALLVEHQSSHTHLPAERKQFLTSRNMHLS